MVDIFKKSIISVKFNLIQDVFGPCTVFPGLAPESTSTTTTTVVIIIIIIIKFLVCPGLFFSVSVLPAPEGILTNSSTDSLD